MFKIEHFGVGEAENPAFRGCFKAGMALAKDSTVNNRFTHKELTLAVGIFVAMLAAFTFWSSSHHDDKTMPDSGMMVPVSLPDVQEAIQKSVSITEFLRAPIW